MGASCSFPLKEEEDSARDGDKEDDRDAYGEEDGSSDEGVERQAVSIRGAAWQDDDNEEEQNS